MTLLTCKKSVYDQNKMHYQFPNKKSKKNLNKVYLSDEQKNISKDTPESLRLLYVALNCLVKARHGGHCNVEYSNKFSKKKKYLLYKQTNTETGK